MYCLLKMNLKRKAKKRLPQRARKALAQPLSPNYCWSIDFMRDTLYSGRTFRTFNSIDDCNREVLAVEVDTNLPAGRVVRVLDRISEERGCYPENIRMDNGPEFIGNVMGGAELHGVELQFIQPGEPTQNSFIERFNRTYRENVVDLYIFNNLSEVREHTEDFIREYNEERCHESLENMTPKQNAYVERYNRTVRYDWLSQYLFESIQKVQNYATRWLWTYNNERPHFALGGYPPRAKLAEVA